MNDSILKISISLVAGYAASALAYETPGKPYFDCWMENIGHVASSEISRLGIKTYGDAWICGCYNVEEAYGEDWNEGEIISKVTKIWDLPEVEVYPCRSKECDNNSDAYSKNLDLCVDHLNSSGFTLADFAEGKKVHGAVAQTFADDGSLTPFGKYFEERKDRLKDISCFFQYHERPDAPRLSDWSRKGVFSISGFPGKLLPETIGRFTDYSDLRCKDKDVWTGFLVNGYIENVMGVDELGKFHGTETAYGNDPRLPVRQGAEFGKVLWTAEYKHGLKQGVAKFYRYSALDNINVEDKSKLKDYYFVHLEVPYRLGLISGNVNIFTDKGFLVAQIPYRNNVVTGRASIHYPFDKRHATLVFKNGELHGPNDLGYYFATYREGALHGSVIYFNVKETCYEWIPANGIEGPDKSRSNKVCRIEKKGKYKWGTYKDGVLQGVIECSNGVMGNENIDCDNAY